MLNIHRLDPDDTVQGTELTDCAFVLNMLVKQWMGKSDFAPGLKVWTRRRGYLFLDGTTGVRPIGPTATGWTNSFASTATTLDAAQGAIAVVASSVTGVAGTYHIGIECAGTLFWTTVSSVAGTTINLAGALPAAVQAGAQLFVYQTAAQSPLVVETALLRDSDLSDNPLRVMTVQTYDALPNKADPTNIGDPSALYFEKGINAATVYFDVGAAQDVTKYAVLTYMEPVQDFVNGTDAPHFPQEWFLALCWGLAEQICPMFRAKWDQKMEQLKNSALAIARNGGAEISDAYFQPGGED
jgi:hypothetical protein